MACRAHSGDTAGSFDTNVPLFSSCYFGASRRKRPLRCGSPRPRAYQDTAAAAVEWRRYIYTTYLHTLSLAQGLRVLLFLPSWPNVMGHLLLAGHRHLPTRQATQSFTMRYGAGDARQSVGSTLRFVGWSLTPCICGWLLWRELVTAGGKVALRGGVEQTTKESGGEERRECRAEERGGAQRVS